MFGRSTSQRFDFTPTSDTPGPGSYDTAASTLLHTNPHAIKKSAAFGESKRWTDIEALITKSNPLLLLPATSAAAAASGVAGAANDRKRVRESVSGGVGGVRRMTVSSQGKRQRGDGEDGKADNSAERAEWEVERQRHADTQRELLRRLKEIKDDWDGEKSGLQQRIEQLQKDSDEKDALIATTNETMAALTQQQEDSASQLQAQLDAARGEKEALTAQLLTITATYEATCQRVSSQQQLIEQLEAVASQHQADIEAQIATLHEEQRWREELQGTLATVQEQLREAQAEQEDSAQLAADRQAEVERLSKAEEELNAELAECGAAIDELNRTAGASTEQLAALQAELDSTISQLRSQQQQRQQLELHLHTLHTEHQRLIDTAATTSEQLTASQQQLEASQQLSDELRQAASRAGERIVELEAQLSRNQDDMGALQQRMEASISSMRSNHTVEVQQLELALQQRQAEHDSSAMQWEAVMQQQTAAMATLEQRLQAEQHARTQLERIAAEVERELETTRALRVESTQQAAEKQTYIDALTTAAAQLNAQLADNEQAIAALQAELDVSQARTAAVQHDMDSAVQQLKAQYEEAQAEWQGERQQQLAAIGSLEQHLAEQKSFAQQLESALTAVRAELTQLQCVQSDTAQQSADRQAEVERLVSVEAQLTAALSDSQSAAGSLAAQLNESSAQLVALQRERNATIDALRVEHQQALSTLDSEMSAQLEQQKQAAQTAHSTTVQGFTAAIAEMNAQFATATSEIEQLTTSKARIEEEWEADRQQQADARAALSQQLIEQQQTGQQLEAQLAVVQAQLRGTQSLQAHTESAVAEKQSLVEQLTAAAATLRAELDSSLSTAASLEAQLSASHSSVAALTADNEQLRSAVSELQLGSEAQQQVASSLRADNKQREEEAERLKGELASVRHELVTLYGHHTAQSGAYAAKCAELETAARRLAERDGSLQLMQEEHVQLIDEYAAAKLETRSSREQLDAATEQLRALSQQMARLTQERDEGAAEKAGLEREIAALEAKYEETSTQQRTLAAAHSTLQAEHSQALSQLQAEQASSAASKQQSEEAIAELMLMRERWARGEDQAQRLQEAMRELETVVAARGEEVERAARAEAELQSRLDVLIVAQVEAGQWRDKYEQSRELCLLLKADAERKQQQLTAAVDERRREEAKLAAAIERLEKQAGRDKEKHSSALRDDEERHKREAVAERRRHAQEMARMAAEKDELNRSTSREVGEYKRGNADMQRRMEAAEAKLSAATATEARLLQEKMGAERRVKELTAAANDREREAERATAAMKEQLTRQLVQPLQHANARLQSRCGELEASLASHSTAAQQLQDVQSQFSAFRAEVVSMTASYEYDQGALRSLQAKNEQLSAAMADMAGHSNERQRIHMHQMIKEENKALKQQLEHAQRQLAKHRREVARLGGAVAEEEEGERRKTVHGGLGKENGGEEPMSGKEQRAEGRKTMGPRHRTALSSMN